MCSHGHRRELSDDGTRAINWMTVSPDPEVVLELLLWKCRRVCQAPDCECLVSALKYTCVVSRTVLL